MACPVERGGDGGGPPLYLSSRPLRVEAPCLQRHRSVPLWPGRAKVRSDAWPLVSIRKPRCIWFAAQVVPTTSRTPCRPGRREVLGPEQVHLLRRGGLRLSPRPGAPLGGGWPPPWHRLPHPEHEGVGFLPGLLGLLPLSRGLEGRVLRGAEGARPVWGTALRVLLCFGSIVGHASLSAQWRRVGEGTEGDGTIPPSLWPDRDVRPPQGGDSWPLARRRPSKKRKRAA